MGSVLVLGAYGLAGRAVVAAVLRTTQCRVVAAGRHAERLAAEFGAADPARLTTSVVDVTDAAALQRACEPVDLVVNAVGPYNLSGAAIAQTVVAARRHYVDCANEQIHYERMGGLAEEARAAGVLMVVAAGLVPGLSTLLAVHVLECAPRADRVDVRYAQLRHAFADGGHASVMGGVLDAVYRPSALCNGQRVPVALGESTATAEFPPPFGPRRFLEVPNIDVPVLAGYRPLREVHTWIDLGDQPTWLFALIRALDPVRRRWAYRIIARVVERLTRKEFETALSLGRGPDAYLEVEASAGAERQRAGVHFTDGASPTAVLPARIVRDLFANRLPQRGLATPIDLYSWSDVEDDLGDCTRTMQVGGR